MTSDGQSIERLREYLRALKPEARSLLVQELERNLLRDGENAGNEMILQELRRAARAESQPVPRIGDAARMFFVPLEPFLIDGPANHQRVGRIARASLDSIWAWLGRDLIPAEAKALSEDIDRALLADDRTKADQLVGALHDCAVAHLNEAIAGIGADDKANRRLAIQVGTPRPIDDVNVLLGVLSLREPLAEVSRRLPNLVRVFERDQADSTKALLDLIATQSSSLRSAGARKSDFFLYSLILLMNRLAAPWQIIRIAARAAESDATARIAETPYAAAVTIVLGELENTVSELRAEFKAGRPIALMLKGIHDAARGLRSEMDLSVDSAWSRQLTAIRADISGLLKTEIEFDSGLGAAPVATAPGQGNRARRAARHQGHRRGGNTGRIRRHLPALRRRARGQRSDGAFLFGTDASSGNRHQGFAGFAAGRRRRRPAVPAIPGRGRDSLLPDSIRRRICGAAHQGR